MQTYTVLTENETLDSIAFKNYGYSFGALEELAKTNESIALSYLFVPVGTVLNIPEIQEQEEERIKLF